MANIIEITQETDLTKLSPKELETWVKGNQAAAYAGDGPMDSPSTRLIDPTLHSLWQTAAAYLARLRIS